MAGQPASGLVNEINNVELVFISNTSSEAPAGDHGTHTKTPRPYIGRYAPSPTGPLHFGSLVAAVGSFLQARCQGGQWMVRIEDLDRPREVPGAADDILHTLETYGLCWDGAVCYQSRQITRYADYLQRLIQSGHAYACGCSRKELSATAILGRYGRVYPGTCRTKGVSGARARAIRARTHNELITIDDALQGSFAQRLQSEVGDFVVRRSDGPFAYQLAVVVDDYVMGVTEVVRGADLLDSTPRQRHLQRLFEMDEPSYMHLPVALDPQGQKLSKQTGAAPLSRDHPVPALHRALSFLNQNPPNALQEATVEELWRWARRNWRPERIPRKRRLKPRA